LPNVIYCSSNIFFCVLFRIFGSEHKLIRRDFFLTCIGTTKLSGMNGSGKLRESWGFDVSILVKHQEQCYVWREIVELLVRICNLYMTFCQTVDYTSVVKLSEEKREFLGRRFNWW
jgi:hypothetical protein